MAVRIEEVLWSVPNEAYNRQVEEAIETSTRGRRACTCTSADPDAAAGRVANLRGNLTIPSAATPFFTAAGKYIRA